MTFRQKIDANLLVDFLRTTVTQHSLFSNRYAAQVKSQIALVEYIFLAFALGHACSNREMRAKVSP